MLSLDDTPPVLMRLLDSLVVLNGGVCLYSVSVRTWWVVLQCVRRLGCQCRGDSGDCGCHKIS